MSVISLRKITPHIGKTALTTERTRTLAGILARHGARVRVARVLSGDGAGQIHLYANFASFADLVQVATAAENDPSRVRLNEERGQNPGGTVDGPEVFRTVFGEVSPGFPVILQREYSIARDKLGNALELLPEIEALVGGHGAKLLAAVPVFSSDMGRLIVAYYFRSPADLGNGMDVVGASQEFQAILVRAAGFASLARSRVVVSI